MIKHTWTFFALLTFAWIVAHAPAPAPTVTDYFFEDRFDVDDAAPLSDPHTTTGGESVNTHETDGSLAVSSGKLTVTKQTTAVDGDLGMIYETSKTAYIGAAAFFKMVPKEFGSTGSAAFGFSDLADNVDNGNASFHSLHMGATVFQAINFEQTPTGTAHTLPQIPSLNDTFYIAYINGGWEDAGGMLASLPWYAGAGLSLGSYGDGAFIFIKKNTGQWILQNVNPVVSRANMYPNINSFNSTYELYDWLVLQDGDSAYTSYVDPLMYENCQHTGGSFYLHNTEDGANADSVDGRMAFSSNRVVALTAGRSTFNLGDDDVYGQFVTNIDNTSTGRLVGFVFRRNSSNGHHVLVDLETTNDAMRIYHFDGTTHTLKKSVAVTMASNSNDKILFGAAVLGKTIYAWYSEVGEFTSTSYTFSTDDSAGVGQNNTGIRIGDTSSGINYIRFYAMGTDDEYSDLTNYFTKTTPATRRRVYFRN